MQVNYYAKYLKYKQKYLDLKEEMMGGVPPPLPTKMMGDRRTETSFNPVAQGVKLQKHFDAAAVEAAKAHSIASDRRISIQCSKVFPMHVGDNNAKLTKEQACKNGIFNLDQAFAKAVDAGYGKEKSIFKSNNEKNFTDACGCK